MNNNHHDNFSKSTSIHPKPVKIEFTSRGFGAVDAASILKHPNVQRDLKKLKQSKLAQQIKQRRSA